MPDPLPGKGVFGWLGRQVGHVSRALRADVSPKVYEKKTVEEQPHPEDPTLLLRRTTIDQAIAKRQDDGK